MAGYYQN